MHKQSWRTFCSFPVRKFYWKEDEVSHEKNVEKVVGSVINTWHDWLSNFGSTGKAAEAAGSDY